ncbi:MAG TPA: hypothetical protein VF731_06045 [Solirubrobacterales bacterium]
MPRLTKALAATAVIAAAVGLLAGAAGATRTIKVPSKVSIASNNLRFTGKVTSPTYTPCAQERKVILYKVVSGGPDQAVGETRTNLKGKWSIVPQGSAGISLAHFYAKVHREPEGTAGTIYVCQAAKSRVVGANS